MYRTCKKIGHKESASQKLMWTLSPGICAQLPPRVLSRLLGEQRTNLATVLNMQFKASKTRTWFLHFSFHVGNGPKGNISNLSHQDLCVPRSPDTIFWWDKVPCRGCHVAWRLKNVLFSNSWRVVHEKHIPTYCTFTCPERKYYSGINGIYIERDGSRWLKFIKGGCI